MEKEVGRESERSSNVNEVFADELDVVQKAETVLKQESLDPKNLAEEYKFLVKKYRGLLKQAMKITKIGDSTQSKLIRTQQVLDRQNEELGTKNRALQEKNEALIRAHEALLQAKQRQESIFSALTEALPGTVLDNKYRLEKKIGTGGYGAVFEATHLGLNRPLAVKVLQPRSGLITPNDLERFRREGISACRITHPNAVAVSDFGISTSGIAYLAMELLQGHTLSDELKEFGRLSAQRSVEILIPVCQALAEAHSAGLVHRDIKPDNIFLHKTPTEEIVKVLDFGLAKLMGEEHRADLSDITQGVIVGTPLYMPPERLSNLPYDGRADIYSLGVLWFEMLTGRVPFIIRKGNLGALVTAHMLQPPPPLRSIVPEISESLENLVLRTLKKIPNERPTAKELAEAMTLFL